MIITEEILQRFRKPKWPVAIQALPDELFPDGIEQFAQDGRRIYSLQKGNDAVLLLGFYTGIPALPTEYEWFKIRHQCGGLVCRRRYFVATLLTPRLNILPTLRAIAHVGHCAENGNFNSTNIIASRVAWYVNSLASIGVNCDYTWHNLEEGVYPIDASPENLARLTEDAPELASLDWGFGRRVADSPAIFFLSENSD